MKKITEKIIEAQAWKFYFVLFSWPVYLFLMPLGFAMFGNWAVIFIIFPGIWLYTWLGYLMHETWHKYVPNIPNRILYRIFCWMMVTDPQIYDVLHWYHHSQVNSWKDAEFHPLGRIENVWFRRFYNIVEVVTGIIFLYLTSVASIPFNPIFKKRFKISSVLSSLLAWAVIYGGIGFLCSILFHIPAGMIAILYLINVWVDSFILHQSQLVEHGNLIVEGDYHKRNVKTRNLRRKGIAAWIFLFLTHWDCGEHVLHHTKTNIYTRPFPGYLPLPKGSVYVTFGQYLKLLWNMLLGRENIVS
jgi:fatty acid desaturase